MSIKQLGSASQGLLRNLSNTKKSAGIVQKQSLSGYKDISTISTNAMLLSNTHKTEQFHNQGMLSALDNVVSYATSALAPIEGIEAELETLLQTANDALDPSMQGSLGSSLSAQYMKAIQNIQSIVDTTVDASGNKILSGVISSFGAQASTTISTIASVGDTTHAANVTAANIALQNIAALNLDVNTKRRLDNLQAHIASDPKYNGFASTIQYLAGPSGALSVISNIEFSPSQIQPQVDDATRAAQIGALLGVALANVIAGAGVGGHAASSIANLKARIIANLLNEAVPSSSPTQTGTNAPEVVYAENAASIAALLTPSEKQALRNYAAMDLPAAADHDDIQGGELRPILNLISCFANIPLLVSNPIIGVVDPGVVVDIINNIEDDINIVVDDVFNDNCKDTIFKYVTTSTLDRITKAKPFSVQIGSSSNDKLSLQILDMSPAGLGNLDKESITTPAGAQTFIAKVKKALHYVIECTSAINNLFEHIQILQNIIEAKTENAITVYDQLRSSNQIDDASKLTKANDNMQAATTLIAYDQMQYSIIAQAAQRMINNNL